MPDFLKADYDDPIIVKKRRNLNSLRTHLDNKNQAIADIATIDTNVAALDTYANSLTAPKKAEFNALGFVVTFRAQAATKKALRQATLNSNQSQIATLTNAVRADGDYSATELAEFENTEDNGVWE